MADETNLPSATVIVRRAQLARVASGHPWIFDTMIERVDGSAGDGDVIAVADPRGRTIGVGLYNSRSRIRVRVLAREPVPIDGEFFERRIRAALALRARYMGAASCYRVVSSEADRLSGVIVDRYEDVLVLQLSSLGIVQRKEALVAALERVLAPRAIVERSDAAARRHEGLPEAGGLLRGELSGAIRASLNGLVFEADVLHGQKTGLYLDQQLNQPAVAGLLADRPGARVLDCFSFGGGFGLNCARAGAALVQMIDQSADAMAAAERNAAANGLLERCRFTTANVFDWLKAASAGVSDRQGSHYDMIVLDPPPFAPNRAALPGALRGYKEIHLRALRLLAPGGLLATFCCSHHLQAREFEQVIVDAARDAHRALRRIAIYTQPPDHPVMPAIPETEYLKGYAYEVLSP
jgi:23S rRNA (cytosine1962-C5)-methyltransferase